MELCNEINMLSTEITKAAQQIALLSSKRIELEQTLQGNKKEQTASHALLTQNIAELDHSCHEYQLRLVTKQQLLSEVKTEFMLEVETVIKVVSTLNKTIIQLTQADMLNLAGNTRVDESLTQPDMMQRTFNEQLARQEQQVKRLAGLVVRIEGQSAEQAGKELRFFAEHSPSSQDSAATDLPPTLQK